MGDRKISPQEAARRVDVGIAMIMQVTAIDVIAKETGFSEDQLIPVIDSSTLTPFNKWWCKQPEGRRQVLLEDKWALAQAAFNGASDAMYVQAQRAMTEAATKLSFVPR